MNDSGHDRSSLLPIGAALLALTVLLAPAAARRYSALLAETPRRALELFTTTFESRRLLAYGYCEPLGLGHLEDVLRALPDPGTMPVVRTGDWDHGVALLLPARRDRTEDRVLVGIDATAEDFSPIVVGQATFRGSTPDGDSVLDHWTFRTQRNVELFLGLALRTGENGTAEPVDLRVRLVESPTSARVLAEWVLPVPAGHRGEIWLPPAQPMERFSVNRGATDFLVEVRRPARMQRPEGIVAVGSRLDGTGWRIVSEEDRCLVAVREDLLAEATRDPGGPWARFLGTASHARPH